MRGTRIGSTTRLVLWTSLLVLVAVPAVAHRVAFVTSVTGSGDLSSWADAGGATGLAAGDAICVARAAAAGLANSANFVAWLSDSSDDAYCRVNGFSGTRAANCGESSLPAAAGPWVRADGMPFAGSIAELAQSHGVVFTPLQYDEFGDIVVTGDIATHTATGADGALAFDGESCTNWTSDAAGSSAGIGNTYMTSGLWTSSGSISCASQARLFCLERISGPALPTPVIKIRRAFLTSASGTGDLSSWAEADAGPTGAEAGDSICRNLATAAGFAEASSFKAWLSTGSAKAAERFVNDGPWETPNGVLFAKSLADLTDGRLVSGIHVTETGDYLGNYGVWSGTQDDGLVRAERCADWTSASGGDTGAVGSSGRTWGAGPGNTVPPRAIKSICTSTACRMPRAPSSKTASSGGRRRSGARSFPERRLESVRRRLVLRSRSRRWRCHRHHSRHLRRTGSCGTAVI